MNLWWIFWIIKRTWRHLSLTIHEDSPFECWQSMHLAWLSSKLFSICQMWFHLRVSEMFDRVYLRYNEIVWYYRRTCTFLLARRETFRLEYETLPEGTNLFLETLVLLHAFECKDHKKKKKNRWLDVVSGYCIFPCGRGGKSFRGMIEWPVTIQRCFLFVWCSLARARSNTISV